MVKIYTKDTWQDEVLSGSERYNILEDNGSAFKATMQIALSTTVAQAGTAANAARMNNIENGIDGLDTLLDSVANTGWTPAPGSWTYASATTINVPAGAINIYSIGDKIRLTQTTFKYFYIVGVADTLLTITGGSDYTLANAAITSNYFSRSEAPVGFSPWFNWTPSFVGWGTPPLCYSRFSISGRRVHLIFQSTATATSNSVNFTISLPVTSRGTGVATAAVAYYAVDNGASLVGAFANIESGSNSCLLYRSGYGAWTASGQKAVSFQMFYEI